ISERRNKCLELLNDRGVFVGVGRENLAVRAPMFWYRGHNRDFGDRDSEWDISHDECSPQNGQVSSGWFRDRVNRRTEVEFRAMNRPLQPERVSSGIELYSWNFGNEGQFASARDRVKRVDRGKLTFVDGCI